MQTEYAHVEQQYPNSEIALLIENNELCGFRDVCQKFLDIALNAPKVKTDDRKLAGVFQYSDINIAKEAATEFINKHNIQNINEFFSIIESEYPQSGAADDKRQKSGFLKEDNVGGVVGYAGTFYIFTRISDDVFQKVVAEIKEALKQTSDFV